MPHRRRSSRRPLLLAAALLTLPGCFPRALPRPLDESAIHARHDARAHARARVRDAFARFAAALAAGEETAALAAVHPETLTTFDLARRLAFDGSEDRVRRAPRLIQLYVAALRRAHVVTPLRRAPRTALLALALREDLLPRAVFAIMQINHIRLDPRSFRASAEVVAPGDSAGRLLHFVRTRSGGRDVWRLDARSLVNLAARHLAARPPPDATPPATGLFSSLFSNHDASAHVARSARHVRSCLAARGSTRRARDDLRHLHLHVTVGDTGEVRAASLRGAPRGTRRCLTRAFERARFPPLGPGECADVACDTAPAPFRPSCRVQPANCPSL